MTEKTNTASAPTAQDIDALIDYLGQVGSMVESSIHISTARAMKARIAEMEVLKEYLSSKISHLVEALDKHNGETICNASVTHRNAPRVVSKIGGEG